MSAIPCATCTQGQAERREAAGWLAAAVALVGAVIAGLMAVNTLAALPDCAPLHAIAPRGDAAYADALMADRLDGARDWRAVESESRLSLSPGRVRTSC
jgi:hypothetical protein